jgi:hypothetical protein
MSTLESYRHTHGELRQMIEDLRSLLTPEQLRIRPNAKTAYELLCDLGTKVRSHLAEEDRSLYPSLLIHEDPKVKSIAWGFISGEKPLAQDLRRLSQALAEELRFQFYGGFSCGNA